MLREYWKISTPKARQFGGGYFDLVVWYQGLQGARDEATGLLDPGRIDYRRRRIVGFQLGYGVEWSSGMALTFLRGRYSHSSVEAGKRTRSPILKATGGFDGRGIAERFVMEAAEIDPIVVDYVLDKLKAYRVEDDVGEWILDPDVD